MKNHRTITTTKRETQRFAFLLAKKLKKAGHAKLAAVIALSGNLGSGKTTFVQGFAKGLGIKGVPKSPTFILMQTLVIGNQPLDAARGRQPTPGFPSATCRINRSGRATNNKRSFVCLVHIDAYRIEKPAELEHLGFKEILKDPHTITVIEWAEKVKELLPKNTMWIYFEHAGKNKRHITIKS
ncbi:MAG: hypothetical protein A2934_02230 [Candidatus Sungbacteria bacterium RIFCSPLOWO2_01_FULL_47_10]|uniref:tRNA threonylcarbamoyladenosine biosynthesis protein TsaE n=1 Tax=Candidatus Sungbacteria bacterium RIFCSPLOWO2_01_FULL_47_10 TaxID=1802276 RepID=A0A1G2L679_9BACT|nr:MAG: hypothetical protein A2934_02230 [Candidatus Sungbacteria bacterium RIFCSPLOWO2_01_FULL_47_10]